jgi:hypothetical protein
MGKVKILFQVGSFLFLAGMVILLLGLKKCQRGRHDEMGVRPLGIALDVPFKEYVIHTDSLSEVKTETGTVLTFQPQSLVYKDGTLAHGKVVVRVREFHDAVDIMRSGIPMRIRSDRDKFLRSAGMLEVRVLQGTDELELQKGRAISTELAAYRSSKDYQLFFLKENNSWETRDTFATRINKSKVSFFENLSKRIKKSKQPIQFEDIIFQLYGDESQVPEISAWKGQNWKIDKINVTQEVLESMRINWDSVRVVKVDEHNLDYRLIFWKTMQQPGSKPDLTHQFSVPVKPTKENVSDLELLADINSRFRKLDTISKEVADEVSRVKREADLVSAFKITQLGIWNIDKVTSLSDFTYINVLFDFQKTLKDFHKVRLFCLLKEDNSVIEIFDWQRDKIYLSNTRPMEIIAILPGEEVAVVKYPQIKLSLRNNPSSVYFLTEKSHFSDFIKKTKAL